MSGTTSGRKGTTSSGATIIVPRERRLIGDGVAPGVAVGRPCYLEAPARSTPVSGTIDTATEGARVTAALAAVRSRLEQLIHEAARRGDTAAADLFEAHSLILADETVETALLSHIAEPNTAAPVAIAAVFDDYVATFDGMADDYLRERAADFTELKGHLLDVLGEREIMRRCRDASLCKPEHCALGNAHILVSGNLDAQITARLDQHTRGFIVETGSARSHGALIARALGVPAVAGIADPARRIGDASSLLVDGDSGIVIIDPTPATLARYARVLSQTGTLVPSSLPLTGFKVTADLDRAERVDDVLAAAAEGVGLYRTELELLARGHLLDEPSQADLYARVLSAFIDAPVCIRLFDLGYDKSVPELQLEAEGNPALGLRGARLLLERPEILRTQARAIARASRGAPVQVAYPMINGVRQFLELKQRFESAVSDIEHGPIEHGVMLEVPSACLQADALFAAADFARVGTSDLTQYLFALDREHTGPAFEDHLSETTLWDFLRQLVRSAHRAGKQLSACGVVASNPAWIGKLIDTGFREVSVEPRRIDAVRRAAAEAMGTGQAQQSMD